MMLRRALVSWAAVHCECRRGGGFSSVRCSGIVYSEVIQFRQACLKQREYAAVDVTCVSRELNA
jgi:hypothetical protein